MRPKRFLPHLYLEDYCMWLVQTMLPLIAVSALLPVDTIDGNRLTAAVVLLSFSVVGVTIVLLRGRGARSLAAHIRARGDIGWALAFDEAQLQDRHGQPLRGFEDGALSIDADGTLGIWPVGSGSGVTPFVAVPHQDRCVARTVHDFRFFAYPTISIDVDPDAVLVVRPLKPRGLPWRRGMTIKETQDAAERLSLT